MRKHVKLFNTRSLYEAFVKSDDYVEPHVSLCKDDNIVNYNKKDEPSFEMVDLGLPSGLKWAKCNVGAEKETDYGMYFAFGEVVGHDAQHCNHFGSIPTVEVDGNKHLLPAYDAATQLMGAGYRMPTQEDIVELITKTDYTVATIDGVDGMKFSKKDDADTYIFIPFAGRCDYGEFISVTENGYLWSSTLTDDSQSRVFNFANFGIARTLNYYRSSGFSVRGVSE